MKNTIKIIGYGLIIWLVPFIAGFTMYSPDGVLAVDIFLFKTIMIVISSLVGITFSVKYFHGISSNYLTNDLIIGLSWLFISWIFDYFILLPMAKMAINTYIIQIGPRYLVILFTTVSMGYLLSKKLQDNH